MPPELQTVYQNNFKQAYEIVVQKLQISMDVIKCTLINGPGKNHVNIYGS